MSEEPVTGGPVPVSAHILRLGPGQDLRASLERYVAEHGIAAGFVVTAVGSLRQAVLRFADQPGGTTLSGKFEIVSLVGTLSPDGAHLHMALSDATGKTVGGHVLRGCEIYTTAEVIVGDANDLRFTRAPDAATGFRELVIRAQSRSEN